MCDGWNDETLLRALGEAVRSQRAVPHDFIETAKNAYAWHSIDAELAQLTYDSSSDARSAGLRSETASIRALTFTSAHVSIELEVTEDSLIGQIVPPGKGTIETQAKAGVTTVTPVDEIGCFSIGPIPAIPFRLHYHPDNGAVVVTGWITF